MQAYLASGDSGLLVSHSQGENRGGKEKISGCVGFPFLSKRFSRVVSQFHTIFNFFNIFLEALDRRLLPTATWEGWFSEPSRFS
jgi:hypothetical protein